MTATPEIKPIETHYAGCRFRSRLEARWAVFFDKLGIPWEYEPQGYLVEDRPYLPDFWLPEMRVWAEVKGELDQPTLRHLVAAARRDGLPHSYTGKPFPDRHIASVRRLLLLGPIPDPKPLWTATHTLLYLIGTEVVGFNAFLAKAEHWEVFPFSEPMSIGEMADNVDPADPILAKHWNDYLTAGSIQLVGPIPELHDAYWAARSARFEHGETPVR